MEKGPVNELSVEPTSETSEVSAAPPAGETSRTIGDEVGAEDGAALARDGGEECEGSVQEIPQTPPAGAGERGEATLEMEPDDEQRAKEEEEAAEEELHEREITPMSADDFLPMFVYAIIHAAPTDLMLTKEMVVHLIDPEEAIAERGYYVASLQAAVQHVLSLKWSATSKSDKMR